jgi:hypothetical protein
VQGETGDGTVMDRDLLNHIAGRYGGHDFDGLEPADIFDLMFHLHKPSKSPMVLKASVSEDLIRGVSLYRDSVVFLETIANEQPVKLTPKGNLPVAICTTLVDRGVVGEDRDWFPVGRPVRTELERPYLRLINTIARLAGLTRKQHGTLTVTKVCRGDVEKDACWRVYSLRTFGRFLGRFGLVEIERDHPWNPTVETIKRTALFDDLIEWRRGATGAGRRRAKVGRRKRANHVFKLKTPLRDVRPPDDVGGPDGYAELLAAIADPGQEDHDRMLEWVGGEFDPERFDPEEVSFDDPDDRREFMLSDI